MPESVMEVKKIEKEMFETYGWVVHYVFETEERNELVNFHTHGVEESFGHYDLQVVLPLAPDIIHPVIAGIVEQIKAGFVFQEGEIYDNILVEMNVAFALHQEEGRKVLRLLIPDPNGKLPFEEGCEEIYKQQYKCEKMNNEEE